MATTLIFIDSRLNDKELLISQFAPGTDYQVLDATRDGIEQMVTALSGQSGYDSIQIISHGAPGSFTIGSIVLNSSNLGLYAAELALLGNALTETGDLFLYGCNVAAGDQGQHFIETLSQMTGADVATSDDATGGTAAGGDWVLEAQTGAVEQAATVHALNYGYLLLNSIPTVSGPLAITVAEGDPSVSLNLLENAIDADLTDTLRVGTVSYTVNGVPSALPAGITMSGYTLTIDPGNTAYNAMVQGEQQTIVATYQVLDSFAATVSFAPIVDYATGTDPRSVTSADVNGNGKLDLIVANTVSNTVSVLKNNGDGTFATKVDYATGSLPLSVTSADVNGDGKADLIVANGWSNTVSVLKNNGDGTFATKVDYETGLYPSSVTSADVNRDGKFDLIVANMNSQTVSVFNNNGDGTFAIKGVYAVGVQPRSVTSADVNGDGKFDLIVAVESVVSVLKNNGDGTFADKADYATGSWPRSVTSADVNGDGKADLIVAVESVVSVLKNNGDGTFASRVDYATGTGPWSVTSADMNGDGKLDLIVADAASSTVSVLNNNGDGTFASRVDYATGSQPYSVTSVDVNSDGKPDLIVANQGSGTVSVLINNSAGFSAYPITTATITINGTNDAPVVTNTAEAQRGSVTAAGYLVGGSAIASGTLTASDVDNGATRSWSIADTTPESTYGNIAINSITGVWRYTLDNTKAATQALQEGEIVTQSYTARVTDEFGAYADQIITVTIHDANDLPTVSGSLVIKVAEGDSSVSLNLLANAHDADLSDTLRVGTVTYTVNGVPSDLPEGITMSGNTLTFDPANTNYNAMAQGEEQTIVATYQVLDSFAAAVSFAHKVDYATGTWANSVTSADVNGDGKSDMIVADAGDDKVSVLINNGDGTFATRVDYATGSYPGSVTNADVNGDGKPDVITANAYSSTVSALINSGDGTFASKADYATGGGSYSVTSADVNGDGKPDLIVANAWSNTVSVLKNNGDGTFATKVDYATGYHPYPVASADVNGDGKSDLIVANTNSDTVSVLKNNGDGTFATKVDYSTGAAPWSVTSADVNGDDKLDLIVANANGDTVSVLKNNGDGTFAAKVDYATGSWPYSVTSADVNGDGKFDLIVANANSDTVSVLKNNGDGTFAPKVDFLAGSVPRSVTSSDVNGDGKYDLIVANVNNDTVSVLINNSTGFSAYPTTTATITINGTNDAPVVDATDIIGAVTELVTPIGNLTDSGTIGFTDFDLTDSHTISSVTASAGALGTLTPTITTDTTGSGLGGIITWNYTVAASAVESLAEGEHKVETFRFSVLDGHGGSAERTVEVVITGTSDVNSAGAFDLAGAVTFWKSGAAIAGVTTTLASAPPATGTQPIEFRNIQITADGNRTIEIWEASARTDIDSVQLELALPTGSIATWEDAAGLPSGWSSLTNTGIAGQFILGGMGITALSAGPIKLGTLTLTALTDAQHFELSLSKGQLGSDAVPVFGISSDNMITALDGLYHYYNMAEGSHALTSAKVSGIAESNAVMANDALAALKIAVGMNPNNNGSAISPYQYLAADVNHDGQVKAADALNILKMAVKLNTAPAKEWIFVPESVGSENMTRTDVVWPDNPIPVTLDMDQELNLIGIVKGDVNGSWAV
jgi:VCBS repeat-containing protein